MSKVMKISKWGTSLGVRIPQFVVDNLELQAGDLAKIMYEGNRIYIELQKAPRPIKLKTPAEQFEEQIRRQLHERGVPGY